MPFCFILVGNYFDYIKGAIARPNAAYGEGSGPIFLHGVGCTGVELRVFDCPHPGLEISSCRHSQDAGVVCRPGKLVRFEFSCIYETVWL